MQQYETFAKEYATAHKNLSTAVIHMSKKFSAMLVDYREKARLTQGEMAAILDLSLRMYQYYERGDFDGSKRRIEKYMKLLAQRDEQQNAKEGESQPHIGAPKTHSDMMLLMRETITALKGENDIQKRYIKLLEDRIKN